MADPAPPLRGMALRRTGGDQRLGPPAHSRSHNAHRRSVLRRGRLDPQPSRDRPLAHHRGPVLARHRRRPEQHSPRGSRLDRPRGLRRARHLRPHPAQPGAYRTRGHPSRLRCPRHRLVLAAGQCHPRRTRDCRRMDRGGEPGGVGRSAVVRLAGTPAPSALGRRQVHPARRPDPTRNRLPGALAPVALGGGVRARTPPQHAALHPPDRDPRSPRARAARLPGR